MPNSTLVNGFTRTELSKLIWSKPYFVQLELTRNCNFKCKFCFENCSIDQKYVDKSFEQWVIVINSLKKLGVKQIHFSGGENFLHHDFIKIVKFAKENDFKVLINTNGYFDISPILDYSDEFVFSVHGYKSINARITNVPKSFERVEKNISLASKKNKPVLINSVLIEDNFKDYLTLLEYLESKYTNLKYSPTLAISCKTGKKFFSPVEINKKNLIFYQKILDTIGEEKLVYKHGLHGLRSNLSKNNFSMPVCAAGKSKLIIKYDGNVYPCNFFQTDEYLCGNVFTDDLEDIWNNGKGFNIFRKYFLDNSLPNKCTNCKKVNNCFSGCRAWTKTYINGDMNLKSEGDVRCEFINAFVGA